MSTIVIPKVRNADPRVLEALKKQLDELRARTNMMPAGSQQRYQSEALCRDHEAQIARYEGLMPK